MKKCLLVLLALFCLGVAPAFASGSTGLPKAAPMPVDPLTVTEVMKCRITAIEDDGTILVQDEGAEDTHPLAYNQRTRFTAQRKKDFDGRRKLELGDLAVGQMLKVTHRPATGEILQVKVLKKQEELAAEERSFTAISTTTSTAVGS